MAVRSFIVAVCLAGHVAALAPSKVAPSKVHRMDRRRALFTGAANALSIGVLPAVAVDFKSAEQAASIDAEKMRQQEAQVGKEIADENALIANAKAVLAENDRTYSAKLKREFALETEETKLIKKLALEGNKPSSKDLQKLKEVEGELSAAKALADADASKIKSERAILNAELAVKDKSQRKLAVLKKEETEDKNLIKEAELLASEEAEVAAIGGKLVGVSEEKILNKSK